MPLYLGKNLVSGAGVGKSGEAGKSAYEAAKDGGFQGTEEEFNQQVANAGAVTEETVAEKIGEHNSSEEAHEDIRRLIESSKGYSKEETLSSETKELFELEENATPDDAFKIVCSKAGNADIDLLWENANISSDFAGQTLALDLTSYSAVFIVFQGFLNTNYGGGGGNRGGFLPKSGITYNFSFVGGVQQNSGIAERTAIATDDGITFGGGYASGSASNRYAKPYLIYGIKGFISL